MEWNWNFFFFFILFSMRLNLYIIILSILYIIWYITMIYDWIIFIMLLLRRYIYSQTIICHHTDIVIVAIFRKESPSGNCERKINNIIHFCIQYCCFIWPFEPWCLLASQPTNRYHIGLLLLFVVSHFCIGVMAKYAHMWSKNSQIYIKSRNMPHPT